MPPIPQASYRLDGEGFLRWVSAPCCGSGQALALGDSVGLGSGACNRPNEANLLYSFILALLWTASEALSF